MTSLSGAALLLAISAACMTHQTASAAPPAQTLTGAQEVPAVDTTASATSSIVVGKDGSVTGEVDTTGIEGTMAHIHQGAVGVSGPIVVTLEKTAPNRWSVPANAKLTSAQFQTYKDGGLYVNVHSVAHKSGEIRMQLTP
jgi:hypothetical protein